MPNYFFIEVSFDFHRWVTLPQNAVINKRTLQNLD